MDHVSNDSKYDIDRNYRFIQKAQKDEEKTTRVIKMLKVHGE